MAEQSKRVFQIRLFAWVGAAFAFMLPLGTRLIYGASPLFPEGEWGRLSWYASELALWLMIVIFVFAAVRHARRLGWPPARGWGHERVALVFALLFAIFLVIRSLGAPDSAVALQWSVRMLGALVLFCIIPALNERELHAWLYAFCAGALLAGLFAVIQFLLQTSFSSTVLGIALHDAGVGGTSVIEMESGRWLRAYGLFAHPAVAGAYGVLAWVLTLNLFLVVKNKLTRIALQGLALLMVAMILFSFSRAAWLVFMFVFLGFLVMAIYKKRLDILSILSAHAVCAVILVVIFYPLVFTRIQGEARLEVRSHQERRTSLKDGWNIIQDNGLLGVGPAHTVWYLYTLDKTRAPWDYQPTHMIYMLVLGELGVIGMTLLFGFIVLWATQPPAGYKANFYCACGVLALFFLFDHFWYTLPQGMFLAALFLGLASRFPLFAHR